MKDEQSALFTVVDEHDVIIGYRTRFECHHNPELIHRAVDVVLYADPTHIILQKRSEQKDTYPGFYTVSASGHVDKGETYKKAAVREMKEELGIRNSKSIRLTRRAKFITRLHHESEMNVLYTGNYSGSTHPAADEVAAVAIVSVSELTAMRDLLTPGAQAALYKLGIL